MVKRHRICRDLSNINDIMREVTAMLYPDEICIRLFSTIFPCPWLDSIPYLKSVSKQLQASIEEDFDTSLPDYLQKTIDLCQGCRHYDPVSVYMRRD